MNSREEVIKANIAVHSAISHLYNNDSHWRIENQAKVTEILKRLAENLYGDDRRLLDLGCGTGFIINLAKNLFHRVDGVDVTRDMLDKVDTSSGNIYLHESLAEDTPFASESFHMVTAYSFLDHVYDPKSILQEVYRVLKPGGIFYCDLVPNKPFWESITHLSQQKGLDDSFLSSVVHREIVQIKDGDTISNKIGLSREIMERSEPGKSNQKGFMANELREFGAEIGFSTTDVIYDWFLGEADLIHNHPKQDYKAVTNFLKRTQPISAQFYKYLRLEFTK